CGSLICRYIRKTGKEKQTMKTTLLCALAAAFMALSTAAYAGNYGISNAIGAGTNNFRSSMATTFDYASGGYNNSAPHVRSFGRGGEVIHCVNCKGGSHLVR